MMCPSRTPLRLVFAVVGLLAAVPPARAAMFYVHDSSGRLGLINPVTRQAMLIGQLPSIMTDLAVAPDGSLYGIDGSRLWRIDPASGRSKAVGALRNYMNALVFGHDGLLYAAGGSALYTLDPATAAARTIGSLSPYLSAGDLAEGPDNSLFLTTHGGELVRVDRWNARSTLVGRTGLEDIFGLAYVDGLLYGMTHDNPTVYVINPQTAAAQPLFSVPAPLGGIYGASPTHLPEPGIASLLLVGAMALLPRTRRG